MKFTKLEDYRTVGDIFDTVVTGKMLFEKGLCTVTGPDGKAAHYKDGFEYDPKSGLSIVRSQREFDALSEEQCFGRDFLLIPE